MLKPLFYIALGLGLCANAAQAADVGVVGLFGGKAILVVEGNPPKTFAVGSIVGNGIKLIAADGDSATIEVHGKKQILKIGQYVHRSAASAGNNVVIQADSRGHFIAKAQINGSGINMLVDTGASMIALSSTDAVRFGIDYRNGRPGYANTANGQVAIYIVKIDSIKIGDIELNQVDAMVQESGLSSALLGMSFLNRMDMRRDGEQMTLTKRF